MPRLEPKIVQRELGQGEVWPVYWIYGQERMKSREMVKRIRKAVLGEEQGSGGGGLLGFAEEVLEGSEVDPSGIIDSAQSAALGGGTRLIIIKDAHAIRNPESLESLLGPRVHLGAAGKDTGEVLPSVCVFLSKDLDGRKKFSKILLEKAAVIPCEDVLETEREAWIEYLAKRRELTLAPEIVIRLTALDPWSLDIADQELEKISLAGSSEVSDVLLSTASGGGGTEVFLDAFFMRDLKGALTAIESFAERTEESLPLLGLMAWNVRHLVLMLAEKESGQRGNLRLNPHAAEKLQRWTRQWSLTDALRLQEELSMLDFQLKQTPLLPLAAWNSLVTRFCR